MLCRMMLHCQSVLRTNSVELLILLRLRKRSFPCWLMQPLPRRVCLIDEKGLRFAPVRIQQSACSAWSAGRPAGRPARKLQTQRWNKQPVKDRRAWACSGEYVAQHWNRQPMKDKELEHIVRNSCFNVEIHNLWNTIKLEHIVRNM